MNFASTERESQEETTRNAKSAWPVQGRKTLYGGIPVVQNLHFFGIKEAVTAEEDMREFLVDF